MGYYELLWVTMLYTYVSILRSIASHTNFVVRMVQIEFRGDGLYLGVLPIDETIR